MKLTDIVDMEKLSLNNPHPVWIMDVGIVDRIFYSQAKKFLKGRINGEIVVDLGCGAGAHWMDKAVTENGGLYVGVDVQDFSYMSLNGEFIHADMYSFLDATKDESVSYIVNSMDNFIVRKDDAKQQLIDGIIRTTKNHVLCLSDDVIRFALHAHPEFTTYDFRLLFSDAVDSQVKTGVEECRSYLFSRTK